MNTPKPKTLTPKEESMIRSAIRRAFSRSEVALSVRKEHRKKVPRYKKDGTRHKVDRAMNLCNVCKKWVPDSTIDVDHIIPVIDVDKGFQSWDSYVARVFCARENLQCICSQCHDEKTQEERLYRQFVKDSEALYKIENLLEGEPTKQEIADAKKILTRCSSKKKSSGIRERALFLKAKLKQL